MAEAIAEVLAAYKGSDADRTRALSWQSRPRTFVGAGTIFGKWTTLISTSRSKDKPLCRCVCGIERPVFISTLLAGESTFCGKYSRHPDILKKASLIKHGENSGGKKSKEYQLWLKIKQKCFNPKYREFHYYGGRGITMAPEWRESFERFLNDVGRAPSPKHSLDRYPNNDGNYEPSNVRWATSSQQNANRRPWASAATEALYQIAGLKAPKTLDDAVQIAKAAVAHRRKKSR